MQGAPFSTVVFQVLAHTPGYVWAILAALVIVGILQMRDRELSRARVFVMPAVLAIYSAYGALTTFGVRFEVIAAWAVGAGAMLALAPLVRWPGSVTFLPDRNTFAVGGSVAPLLVLLAVFSVRYVATVTLILNPQWRGLPATAVAGGLVFGLLAGVFAMRARTILSHARPSGRLLAA